MVSLLFIRYWRRLVTLHKRIKHPIYHITYLNALRRFVTKQATMTMDVPINAAEPSIAIRRIMSRDRAAAG